MANTNQGDADKILQLFQKPALIGLIGDVNSGKTETLCWIVEVLREKHSFDLYSYGLRVDLGGRRIYSVEELESKENSIILIDEFSSLVNLDERGEHRLIEASLRLLFHKNNIVLLAGVPDNFRKFIASKLSAMILKKSTIGDAVNGSRVKKVITNFRGLDKGAAILNIPVDVAWIYDGNSYEPVHVPYRKEYDSKRFNASILTPKNVAGNVAIRVQESAAQIVEKMSETYASVVGG